MRLSYLCRCVLCRRCRCGRISHSGGRRTDRLAGCAGHREGECRPASRHGGSLRASVLRLGRAARHTSARLRPRGRRRLDGGSAREPRGMHPYSEIWRILQSARSASGAGAPRGWRRSAAGSDAGRGPARTCHLTSLPLPSAADSAADAGRGPARTCLPCLDALALAITAMFRPPAAAVPALPRHGVDCPDRTRPRRGAMSRGCRPHGPCSPAARRASAERLGGIPAPAAPIDYSRLCASCLPHLPCPCA